MLMFYILQTSGLVVYLIEPADKSGECPQASLSHERFMNSKECADFKSSLWEQQFTRRENVE
jgi:hypothetical protein